MPLHGHILDETSGQFFAQRPAQELGEALQDLADSLLSAKRPAVLGLSDCDIDSQRWAVAIADRTRSILDPDLSWSARAKTLAMQQAGEVTATWGEIKNRATLFVYWNCVSDSAPRFRQRYGDLADSCLDLGTRTVFAVGDPAVLATWDDDVIKIECDSDSFLDELQMLVDSGNQKPDSPAAPLMDALKASAYSAFVVARPTMEDDLISLQLAYEKLTDLIRSQNKNRRAVLVPWGSGTGNATGAQSVLTWRSGYPMAVDFLAGFPQYRVPENFWQNVLQRQATDFVLWIGSVSPQAKMTIDAARERLGENNFVQIGPQPDLSFGKHITAASSHSNRRSVMQRPDSVMLHTQDANGHMQEILKSLFGKVSQKALN